MERRLYPVAGLHGQVAHDIGRRIVTGVIAEGSYLPRESELSEEFSVSRQAVREGLKVLAAKGLVSSRRRAGTSVTPRKAWNLLDPDVLAWHGDAATEFYREMFELRRLVEPAAAAFAAERATAPDLARIAAAIDAMRASVGDPEPFQKANVDFHVAVFAASGNSLIERLNMIIGPMLAASYKTLQPPFPIEDYHQSITIMTPIYEAICARDPVAARAATEASLSSASAYFDTWPARRRETLAGDTAEPTDAG
jgi:DNA-binding FadR family transcriptional regulator